MLSNIFFVVVFLQHFEWAVGTALGATDVMPWRVTISKTEAEVNLPAPLEEGQVR